MQKLKKREKMMSAENEMNDLYPKAFYPVDIKNDELFYLEVLYIHM
jgi:hypothetical protein